MKFFECADGALINPDHVTMARAYTTEGKGIAQFCFADDSAHEVLLSSRSYAEGEVKAFRAHCEEL